MRTLAIFLCLTSWLRAADYYVDFEAGDDSNAGTSTGAAWQHFPDDTNATGTSAATTLVAGDTVYFKKGVRYQGQFTLTSSGTSGNPITLSGNAEWGVGEAIIDGTTTLTWNVCTGNGSGATEVNNSNFASIYYATLPSGLDWLVPIIEGGVMLDIAGTDSYDQPFFYSDTDHFHNSTSGVTTTTVADSTNFTSADSTYYDGGVMLMHLAGNALGKTDITSFNPGTDTITFDTMPAAPTTTGPGNSYEYRPVNAQTQLNGAGQVAVDVANSIIYCWPLSDINDVRVGGNFSYGIHIGSQDFVTVEHLTFEGHYDDALEFGRAITGSTSSAVEGVVYDNNTFRNIDGDGASGSVALDSDGAGGSVTSNTFSYIRSSRGIILGGSGQIVANNDFEYVMGTVVFSLARTGVDNDNGTIRGNTIDNCFGIHANGISVYGFDGGAGPSDWVIEDNTIINSSHRYGDFDFSCQWGTNFTFRNNVFEGNIVIEALTTGDHILFQNNTVGGYVRLYDPQQVTTCEVTNNFIDDGLLVDIANDLWSDIDYSYNTYITLSFTQSGAYGWALGTGETDSANTIGDMFTDPGNDDYTLKAGSELISAGTDLSGSFTDDITGAPRSGWDIGAYAHEILSGTLNVTGTATIGP